ncbi:MAG: DUF2339 domain-containing protein [bacterium]|nr:DUF2339 domain-containing protein [bacterium]
MDEQRIAALESRVAELERHLLSRPKVATVTDDYRTAPPPRVGAAASPTAAIDAHQPVVTGDQPAPRLSARGISVGASEVLLKWAGVGLVVLAVVFALGLAIDRGWITPVLRVIASAVVAVALFVAGHRMRRSRPLFAETLQGASFVVAYLTALSALVMDVVSGNVGFVALVGVTVAALVSAKLLDSPPIGVLGVLGGLATPLLLQSGIDDAAVLAFYVPLLAGAGWTLYSWTGWRSIANATALATWILLWVGAIRWSTAGIGVAVVLVGLMSWLVPLGRSILESRRDLTSRPTHFMEQALQPFLSGTTDRLTYAAPVVTLALAAITFELTRYQWSPIVAGTGAVFALAAVALTRSGFADRAFVHTTMAALLASVGLTLALNGHVLLVSLGLQALALAYIADRLSHEPMKWQALAVFAIALLAVAGRSFDRGFDGSAASAAWLSELAVLGLATWRAAIERDYRAAMGAAVHVVAIGWLFTILGDPWIIVAIVGLYATARITNHFGVVDFEFSIFVNALAILLVAGGAAAGLYAGEIDYSIGRVVALASGVVVLAALFSRVPHPLKEAEGAVAYLTLLAWIVVAAGSSDAWITGGWVLVGIAALAAGVRLALDHVQIAGWATLGIATLKLLLVDLEATEPLVRIGLFFGIGVAFLGLAYLIPTRLAVAEPEAAIDSDSGEVVPANG